MAERWNLELEPPSSSYQPNLLTGHDTNTWFFRTLRFWERSNTQLGHISSRLAQGEHFASCSLQPDIMWPCFQIARRYEVDKNTAQAELKRLSRKLADITNDNNDNSGQGSKRRKVHHKSPSADLEDDDNDTKTVNRADEHFVFQAGHKFFLLHAPWIHSGEGLFEISIDQDYNPSERFENDENKSQGQLKEIFDLLQVKFQPQAQNQRWLRRQVSCIYIPQPCTY